MGCTLGGSAEKQPDHAHRHLRSRSDSEVALDDVVSLLHRTHLFKHLPTDEQIHVLLARACSSEDFEPGQTLCKQGDNGDAFYAIRKGEVSVIVDGEKVNTWRVGADFGEHALLHDEPRHATIIAETPVTTLKITREMFWSLGLNRKLHFEGRKAVTCGLETHNRKPTPKTPEERELITEALTQNENLQAMVRLDDTRLSQLVDVAWKVHVQASTEVIVEGELADCFYIVQEGDFRTVLSSSDSYTEGQSDRSEHSNSPKVSYAASPTRSLNDDSDCMISRSVSKNSVSSAGNRRPQYADTISKGGSFGELALLYNMPRVATVRAVSDAVVWGIDRKPFKDILMKREEEHLQRNVRYLNSVTSLDMLMEEEKLALAEAMVQMNFKRGDIIIQQGEPSYTCHLLYEGSAEVIKDGRTSRVLSPEHPSREVTCGFALGCFGGLAPKTGKDGNSAACCPVAEHALMHDEPCQATVKVRSETAKTFAILRESFDMLIGDLEKLNETRQVRQRHHKSMRGAVQSVNVQTAISQKPNIRFSKSFRPEPVPSSSLRRIKLLGSGAFGNVELCEDSNGASYALKILSKGHIEATGSQHNVVNERNVMLMTASPFIVQLYEVYNDHKNIYFLMEYASGGELYTIYNRLGLYGSTQHAKFNVAGVVLALQHLHSLHIIYRDLKPENVIFNSQGIPKLSDMGLAKFTIGITHTFCGTPDYIAPEVIKHRGYNLGADWWSVGVLVFELLAGCPPFESVSPMKTWKKALSGIDKVRFPAKCQGHVCDFIKGLMQKESSDRIPMRPGHAKNVFDHPWYNGFDWEAFKNQTMPAPYLPSSTTADMCFNSGQETAPMYPDYVPDGSGWDLDLETTPFTGFAVQKRTNSFTFARTPSPGSFFLKKIESSSASFLNKLEVSK